MTDTAMLLVDTTQRIADGTQVTMKFGSVTKLAIISSHQARVVFTEAELAGIGATSIGEANFQDEAGSPKTVQAQANREQATITLTNEVIASASEDNVVVSWGVSSPGGTGRVRYGTNPAQLTQATALSSTISASHTFTVGNLSPGTQYYFRPESQDASGNIVVGNVLTATTTQPSQGPENVVPTITPSSGQSFNQQIQFNWSLPSDLGWVYIQIGTGKTPHPEGGGRFDITGRLPQEPGKVDAAIRSITVNQITAPIVEIEYAFVAKGGTGPNGEDWNRVFRQYVTLDNDYEAPVVPGEGSTNSVTHNGIGALTSTAGYQVIDTAGEIYLGTPGQVYQNKIIRYTGPARSNGVLKVVAADVTIRNVVVWNQNTDVLSSSTSGNGRHTSIFVDQVGHRCTIDRVNTFGGSHGVYSWRARGVQVTNSVFARVGRHGVLLHNTRNDGTRRPLIARCYGYFDPQRRRFTAGSSTDGFNSFCSANVLMENCLWENGKGPNGSCFIIDGFYDGFHVEDNIIRYCTGINGGNKFTAIAAGRNNLVENCDGVQLANNPSRFAAGGNICAYIADYRSPNNPKSPDFRNNRFRDLNISWYIDSRPYRASLPNASPGMAGIAPLQPQQTSDTLFSSSSGDGWWGWPASAAVYENVNANANINAAALRATAIGRLGNGVPAYVINGETLMGLQNEV